MIVDFHQGFLNNMSMGIAFYHIHSLSNAYREEIHERLSTEINLENPVALDLRNLPVADQRLALIEIETFFLTQNQSPRFPYPVYILTDLEDMASILVTLKSPDELPKFFSKRSSKLNVKETHLSQKNSLLQRAVKNSDPLHYSEVIKDFSEAHQTIYHQERERLFYEEILGRLKKGIV
jgi:hypothetical protein